MSTLIYFTLLVGVLIFVHELGHFLFAKLFNVKVLKFSLGFGPRALSFRRGETEYCVSWLPLGGFVKMLGEDPNDEVRYQDQGRAFHQKPLWQRYIIVFAGPAFNLIFPIFIYFVFYATQDRLLPSVIGKVFADQPAAAAGLEPGDKVTAIDGNDVRYWSTLKRYVSARPNESMRFTIERDGKTLDRYIRPREEVVPNRLGLTDRRGLIGISPFFEYGAQVGVSDPGSPAARAGLRTGDVITSLNGKPVRRIAELLRRLKRSKGIALRVSYLRPSKSVSGFVDLHLLRPRSTVLDPEARYTKGQSKPSYYTGLESAELFVWHVEPDSPAAKMGMRAGDKITELDGKPVSHWTLLEHTLSRERKEPHVLTWVPYGGQQVTRKFKLERKIVVDEYKNEQERWVFGAANQVLRKTAPPIPIQGRFSYAVVESVRKTGEIVGVMVVAIVQLFRGAIPRNTIGGPVMLAYTAKAAAEKGWDHFLWMMALISINLGIINLLPVPILDGGHIMFFTIEAIKRKPLSLRAREVFSYVGLVLLISLMVFALKNDIARYWTGK